MSVPDTVRSMSSTHNSAPTSAQTSAPPTESRQIVLIWVISTITVGGAGLLWFFSPQAGEHLIGFFSSVIAFVMFLPQALRTFAIRNDHHALLGVSLGMQHFIVVNALSWFAYGAVTEAFWIAAPGFVNLPLAAVNIVMVVRARRTGGSTATDGTPSACPYCDQGVWHKEFILSAPGFGSVMTCTGSPRPQSAVIFTPEAASEIRRAASIGR